MKREAPFKLFGIFGHPLSHTLSPPMHEAGFEALGIKAFYGVFDLEPRDFLKVCRGLHRCLLDGFNVTVPYKQTILPHLDRLTPEAKAVGAVNTVFRKGKQWWGTNTDVFGFRHSLETEGRFFLKKRGGERRALVLGAGGAARAAVCGLAQQGLSQIAIANRHPKRAETLKRDFSRHFPRIHWTALGLKTPEFQASLNQADLVVQATPVGLEEKADYGFELQRILPAQGKPKLFLDLIYHVPQTPLLKEAARKGHSVLGGLDMLLWQGVRAFEIWTGRKAPVGVMKQQLTEALRLRSSLMLKKGR